MGAALAASRHYIRLYTLMDTLQHPPPGALQGPGAWLPTGLRRAIGWSLLLLFTVGLLGLVGGRFTLWPGVRDSLKQATVQVTVAGDGRTGSGVLIGSGGVVLTAAHVVHGAPEGSVTVTVNAGQRRAIALPARLTRWMGQPGEPRPELMAGDWAILQVNSATPLPGLQLAPGEPADRSPLWVAGVVALKQGSRPRRVIESGRLTARMADYRGAALAYNTDAVIRPGMSGGPCVDKDGALVGLCVMYSQEAPANLILPVAQFRGACEQALAIYGGAAPR